MTWPGDLISTTNSSSLTTLFAFFINESGISEATNDWDLEVRKINRGNNIERHFFIVQDFF
jgi:hypothetical protein